MSFILTATKAKFDKIFSKFKWKIVYQSKEIIKHRGRGPTVDQMKAINQLNVVWLNHWLDSGTVSPASTNTEIVNQVIKN